MTVLGVKGIPQSFTAATTTLLSRTSYTKKVTVEPLYFQKA